jgi:hypothetical protein
MTMAHNIQDGTHWVHIRLRGKGDSTYKIVELFLGYRVEALIISHV